MADDLFANIEDEEPYKIKDSDGGAENLGHQSPYNSEEAQNSLKTTKTYNCAVNFFWYDVMATPSPYLPVLSSMVADYE